MPQPEMQGSDEDEYDNDNDQQSNDVQKDLKSQALPINELARIIAARAADDILDDSSYVVKSIEVCDNKE